ncbi:MAG: HDOD domain-containing protein [Phycisphaerae bacterium]|nr:HDOD domain-containing protein [Phycisphaerae bacterium]
MTGTAAGGFPCGSEVLDRVAKAAEGLDFVAGCSDRMLEALSRPGAVAEQWIEAVIEEDPVVAVRMVQLANTRFFGMPGYVDSLRDAICVVGPQAVRSAAACLLPVVGTGVGGELVVGSRPYDVRRYSVTVACACRAIAQRRCCELTETAYLTGLVHEIGVYVLHTLYPRAYGKVLSDCPTHVLLDEYERVCVGVDHAEVGALVLERLRFPRAIVAAVGAHHASDAGGREDEPGGILSVVLRLAIECGRLLCSDRAGGGLREIRAAAARLFDLSAEEVEEVLTESRWTDGTTSGSCGVSERRAEVTVPP